MFLRIYYGKEQKIFTYVVDRGIMLQAERKQRRRRRLESLLIGEISEIILNSVKDPACAGAVLTGVKLSSDFSQALVAVRARHEHEDVTEVAIPALNRAAGFIQHELGAVLTMKRTPKLKFVEDEGIVESVRISTIINELRKEGKMSPGGDSAGDTS